MRPTQILLCFVLILVPATVCSSAVAQNPDQLHRISGTTMGTITYDVTVDNGSKEFDTEQAAKAIAEELDRVNDMMSTYTPDSDVSRFNSRQSTDWFEVSADTARVVARALELSRETDGSFDITVGPLVNRWNFGPGKSEHFKLPEPSEIQSLLESVGYEKLSVRIDPPAIRKTDVHLQIDLSAIAKGFAVDQVSRALLGLGYDRFLVTIGGEVYASREKNNGEKWRVAIVKPVEVIQSFDEVASLKNLAMATSGDYRNFEVVDGKRYSHTIDPRTGWPVDHSLASASVVAKDCMTADAVATAVMVLGAEKGHQLSKRMKFELHTYQRNSNGFSQRSTDSFPLETESGAKTSATARFWNTMLIAVVVFGIAIAGMAIGVIVSDRKIKGSCGGLANLKDEQGDTSCSICSTPSDACKDLREAKSRAATKNTAGE